jgi:glycerophosphoryl diester phosphodiesterase
VKKLHPWIIAHRGVRDETPENTGSALRRAATLPIDGVEFDVQMSADGVAVLFHDRTLMKINRRRSRVAELTHMELRRIDWGRWYHADFAGEPLTTLGAALEILKNCPHICIEIKSDPVDRKSGHVHRLTEHVVALLKRPEMQETKARSLILSFDPEVLARAYRLDHHLRCLLNLNEKEPLKHEPETRHLWAVGISIGKLSASMVQWAHRRDLKVFTYTCNGPRQVAKAVRAGVDGIITDKPAWLAQRLEKP